MKSRKPFLTFLLISLLSFMLLAFLILEKSPSDIFQVSFIGISTVMPFFILLFLGVFGLVTFIFKNKLQGIIITSFLTGYLLLRFFGFIHIFFLILIVALFAVLEFALLNR